MLELAVYSPKRLAHQQGSYTAGVDKATIMSFGYQLLKKQIFSISERTLFFYSLNKLTKKRQYK